MTVPLNDEARQQLLTSLRHFANEELDLDIGDLKASLLLDFGIDNIGAMMYNQGVADAQRYLIARAEEMSGTVYATPGGGGRGKG